MSRGNIAGAEVPARVEHDLVDLTKSQFSRSNAYAGIEHMTASEVLQSVQRNALWQYREMQETIG
jgi:hypothetical protein